MAKTGAPDGNQNAIGNNGGRPSKYDPEYAKQAYKLCLLGHTDEELAHYFEVTEATINNWKAEHIEFFESIKKGKAIADGDVAESLYKRAIGYSHDDIHFSTYEGEVTQTPTVKHYPPDPTAAIFWLKNRQKKHWRDKIDLEHSGKIDTNDLSTLSDEQLAKLLTSLETQAARASAES